MREITIIFRREVGQYFASPIAYLIAFAILLLTGFLFNNDLAISAGTKSPETALVPAFLSFGMVFFSPLLTMRMLSEETREGTLELLLTAPVDDFAIVLGKFLSAWFYFTIILITTLPYLVILYGITQPDFGAAISAYLGIWLYGGATLAVGIIFSAVTENQIVAAFLSMATLLFLWLADLAGQVVASIELARLFRTLSLQGHFSTSFAVGIVRMEDIVFYAGVIVIALFITMQIIASRRWRG